MKTFILVLFVKISYAGGAVTIPFETLADCEAARQHVSEGHKSPSGWEDWPGAYGICIEKLRP